jgi:hypothetical protein
MAGWSISSRFGLLRTLIRGKIIADGGFDISRILSSDRESWAQLTAQSVPERFRNEYQGGVDFLSPSLLTQKTIPT